MSQSAFAKARVLSVALVHQLLDKQIDNNSIAVVKQYVRELETERASIAAQVAFARGRIVSIKRDCDGLEAEIATCEETIDFILFKDGDDTNNDSVIPLESNLESLEELFETAKSGLTVAETNLEVLANALKKVDACVKEKSRRVRELEQIERSTQAMNDTASTLEKVNTSLSSAANSDSVDNLERRIREDGDVASARFNAAIDSMQQDDAQGDLALLRAKQRVAERIKRKKEAQKPSEAA